jgi:uncharacterized protein YutE (UPF0331/DUF86 family)
MVNKEIALRKLSKLKSYLDELAAYEGITWEQYKAESQLRRAVERLIQLVVDVAVDINSHAVVDEKQPPPRDAFDSFIQAGRLGMFTQGFAEIIAPSTGERNIIVHEYEQIDDAIVYHSIKEALVVYHQYISYVLDFVEKRGQA